MSKPIKDLSGKEAISRILSGNNVREILGIPEDANERDIKKAYRTLALKVHPDKNSLDQAQHAFQKLGGLCAELLPNQDVDLDASPENVGSEARWQTRNKNASKEPKARVETRLEKLERMRDNFIYSWKESEEIERRAQDSYFSGTVGDEEVSDKKTEIKNLQEQHQFDAVLMGLSAANAETISELQFKALKTWAEVENKSRAAEESFKCDPADISGVTSWLRRQALGKETGKYISRDEVNNKFAEILKERRSSASDARDGQAAPAPINPGVSSTNLPEERPGTSIKPTFCVNLVSMLRGIGDSLVMAVKKIGEVISDTAGVVRGFFTPLNTQESSKESAKQGREVQDWAARKKSSKDLGENRGGRQ